MTNWNEKAKKIFFHADAFLHAVSSISETVSTAPRNQKPQIFIPLIANTSLAIELYFKCIYVLENSEEPPQIHNLQHLFEKLEHTTQDCIKQKWEDELDTGTLDAIDRKAGESITTRNFEDAIHEASDSFKKWRYSFDYSELNSFNLFGLPEILRDYIIQENPDW